MNKRKILVGITLLVMTSLACGFRAPSFLRGPEQPSATAQSEEALPVVPTQEGLTSTAEPPRVVVQPTAGPTPTLVPDSERQQFDDEESVLVNLYQRVNPAVVYIAVSQNGNNENDPSGFGTGSGFVIDTQGHIVTNNHVVAGADSVDVSFADGTIARATIVGRDPYSDLAVIKVDLSAEQLTPVELGDSNGLQPGQKVIAIGNPFGLAGTMTTGIISAIGRTLPESGDENSGGSFINPEIIQTDAAINPGNSGGPLLDSRGRVIGVNTAIRSLSSGLGGQPVNSGIGFAVPVNTVKRVAPALIAEGRIRYPYLGITSRDGLNLAEIAEQLNVNVSQGVLVFEVIANGPAARAGLRGGNQERTMMVRGIPVPLGGDIITAINGTPVKPAGYAPDCRGTTALNHIAHSV
jgi:2-alkenal reductase